nr:MAG TPA: hypothetical protein [Bacteriophage sp.]
MGSLSREEKISSELNEVLTGLLLEVFSGVTKKEEALELLAEIKARIMPAVRAIDETAAKIQKQR